MASLIPGYEYDIFVSYRQKDNKGERWVTEFVNALKTELEATFKEDISIYFDENPHDGLLANHQVDQSLSRKLKCLIFVPIISQTYCDPNSYAWQQELLTFIERAKTDVYGSNVQLSNGNVASRVLPIRIHELSLQDQQLLEGALQGKLRSVDFIYRGAGVNRSLRPKDDELHDNEYKTIYRNQINKVANAIKSLIEGLKAVNTEAKQGVATEVSENGMSIGEEIKKRDLVKVALAYSIVALLTWKLVEITGRLLSLSSQLANVTALILCALFPVALFLAWRFEKAPTGFVRSNSSAAKNNPFSSNQKKPLTSNTAILALLVVMLVLYFVPQQVMPELSSASLDKTKEIDNKSIAVLYFDNLSGDPDQEYMSDGLTEEIISRLTKIKGLRVISRASVRAYKDQAINLKKIREELNVDIFLLGSLRKSDNQLKITAQLVDAETDEYFWSEIYDRELKEVFSVQTEIAETIAEKFEIEMSPEVNLKVRAISTRNTEAYDCYLRGRFIAFNDFYYIGDSLAFDRARAQYERAIELDPDFALAYAGLADLYDAALGIAISQKKGTPEMDSLRQSLSWKAYQLDSNSAFVNNVRIWMLANRKDRLLDSAFFHARRALQIDPNDYYNFSSMGDLLTNFNYGLGLFDCAIPFYEKAIALSPLDPALHAILAFCYAAVGRPEDSAREYQKAYELGPATQYFGVENTIVWLINNKRLDEAQQMLDRIIAKHRTWNYPVERTHLLIARGDKEAAIKLMDETNAKPARLYILLGNKEEALNILQKNLANGRNNYLTLKNSPYWSDLRNEPIYQQVLAKYKLDHEANIKKYGRYLRNLLDKN